VDRLLPLQQLQAGQSLVSHNGWFSFRLLGDGVLTVRREQTGSILWAAAGRAEPNCRLRMQADGNLVAETSSGIAYWTSGTGGYPGASLWLRDDGNLVVLDGGGQARWASNTGQDLQWPTLNYSEAGFVFNETSESWKDRCSVLPCFRALFWPGYATTVVEDTIDGHPVVIQLWKGLCPKFLGFAGLNAFPGGVGEEVGIYRRIPGKVRPSAFALGFLPPDLMTRTEHALASLSDDELWWPFPELGAHVEFSFVNPITRQPVFSAGPETGYWLTKWMNESSHATYQRQQPTPSRVEDYVLTYRINGRPYPGWPPAPASVHGALEAAVSLLLS
jgi:hypothetical protein